MAAKGPSKLTMFTYDVGFGDCFLLAFDYPDRKRYVLIDFGSMRLPTGKYVNGKPVKSKYLNYIAEQIASDCEGRLDVVVATHRHQDHISGFARANGKGPGEIIRGLKPRVVIQPWTEDPHAARDATEPTKQLHVKTLSQMQRAVPHFVESAKTLRGERFKALRAELAVIGMDNIQNRDAVDNLRTMAPNKYVYHKKSPGLSRILPGVKVTVLGPPTVKQTNSILKQRSRDPDEFWQLTASFWQRLALTAKRFGEGEPGLFPKFPTGRLPRSAGWYKYSATREHADSLLSIVRSLDKAMNNTSVILLFETSNRSILFPGDAQYENWMYALSQKSILKQLSKVDVYKVGHHGSLNATPRTLWKDFARKGTGTKRGQLISLLSTKSGVHGSVDRNTEVPRRSLVNALRTNSHLTTTEDFAPDELRRVVTVPL